MIRSKRLLVLIPFFPHICTWLEKLDNPDMSVACLSIKIRGEKKLRRRERVGKKRNDNEKKNSSSSSGFLFLTDNVRKLSSHQSKWCYSGFFFFLVHLLVVCSLNARERYSLKNMYLCLCILIKKIHNAFFFFFFFFFPSSSLLISSFLLTPQRISFPLARFFFFLFCLKRNSMFTYNER